MRSLRVQPLRGLLQAFFNKGICPLPICFGWGLFVDLQLIALIDRLPQNTLKHRGGVEDDISKATFSQDTKSDFKALGAPRFQPVGQLYLAIDGDMHEAESWDLIFRYPLI